MNPKDCHSLVRKNEAVEINDKMADVIYYKNAKGDITGIQAIRFPKDKFSESEARKWSEDHDGLEFEPASKDKKNQSGECECEAAKRIAKKDKQVMEKLVSELNTVTGDSVYTAPRIKHQSKCKADFIVAIDRSTFKEDQEGLHFHGVLSVPRASLNGWIYLPEELAKQNGKTVTLFINHEEMFTENPVNRGTMSVVYNPETFNLEYNATATDQEAIEGVKSGKYKHVSMGAMWAGEDKIRGWLIPYGVEIIEGSLVDSPGIPESTVVMDSAFMIDHVNGGITIPLEKCNTEFCKMLKSSLKNDLIKNTQTMSQTRKTKTDSLTTKLSEALNKILEDEENTREDILKQIAEATDLETEQIENILSGNSECPTDKIEAFHKVLNLPIEDKKPDKKADSRPQEVVVKLDATQFEETLLKHQKAMAEFAEKYNAPKPKGAVATDDNKRDIKADRDKFYAIVGESLKKFQAINWDFVGGKMKADGIGLDAIGVTEVGNAAGAQWLEDLTIIPSGLETSLRSTCQVVTIQRGAKEVHFTLISTPTPGDGSAPTVPADVTHTITDVIATPAERILKQRLTDQAARFTAVNLGRGIADTFRKAEMLDEDQKILAELNTLPVANLAGSFFGGNATAESNVDSADVFDHKLLAKAKRAILRKGWQEARIPGQLVCVMSPEQMEQLMADANIQRYIEWVQNGQALVSGFVPRLHGIDLLVSTEVPTGVGSPTTVITHRAFVYIRQVSVGLGFTKDLEIESARYVEERATTIVATYELAAKTKSAISVARIVTYGSG